MVVYFSKKCSRDVQFFELLRQLLVNAVDWRMFHIFGDVLGEGELNFDWLKRKLQVREIGSRRSTHDYAWQEGSHCAIGICDDSKLENARSSSASSHSKCEKTLYFRGNGHVDAPFLLATDSTMLKPLISNFSNFLSVFFGGLAKFLVSQGQIWWSNILRHSNHTV